MEKAVVEFVQTHPWRSVAIALGVTLALALMVIAVDIGVKEIFRWYGGW